MSMKNSNDTIGNRSLDLAVCSAVPQTNASPRASIDILLEMIKIWKKTERNLV
jgi:hypothetical protein